MVALKAEQVLFLLSVFFLLSTLGPCPLPQRKGVLKHVGLMCLQRSRVLSVCVSAPPLTHSPCVVVPDILQGCDMKSAGPERLVYQDWRLQHCSCRSWNSYAIVKRLGYFHGAVEWVAEWLPWPHLNHLPGHLCISRLSLFSGPGCPTSSVKLGHGMGRTGAFTQLELGMAMLGVRGGSFLQPWLFSSRFLPVSS